MNRILFVGLVLFSATVLAEPEKPTRLQAGASVATEHVIKLVEAALKNPAKAEGPIKEHIEQAIARKAKLNAKESKAILLFRNDDAYVYVVSVVFDAGKETAGMIASVGLRWGAPLDGSSKQESFHVLETKVHPDKDVEVLTFR